MTTIPRQSFVERLLRFAVATMMVAGLAGCQFPGTESSENEPSGDSPPHYWAKELGFADNPEAIKGAEIFAQAGCASCHTYLGSGASSLGAPDLSSIGKDSPRSIEGFAAYVADPSRFGNDVMPRFSDLGRVRLLELGAFLAASEGRKK